MSFREYLIENEQASKLVELEKKKTHAVTKSSKCKTTWRFWYREILEFGSNEYAKGNRKN